MDERHKLARSSAVQAAETIVVPVVEEQLDVRKHEVESGRVRVRTVVSEREEMVDVPLRREEIEVERVPVNRIVEGSVDVRYEGDTMIVPVLEEVLVLEKRTMLKEEIRVTKKQRVHNERQSVTLRAEEAFVERLGGDSGPVPLRGPGEKRAGSRNTPQQGDE